MIRRIRQFAVLVSTLLMVGCVAIWVRSYWRYDHLAYLTGEGGWYIMWVRGIVVFVTDDLIFPSQGFGFTSFKSGQLSNLINTQTFLGRRGFGYVATSTPLGSMRGVRSNSGILTSHSLHAPFWSLTLLFAILPAWTLIRYLRQRIPEGHCKTCGYDLRASKERCPECGTPIAATDASAR